MKKTIQRRTHNLVFILSLFALSPTVYCAAGPLGKDTAVITKISGNKNQHIVLYSSSDRQYVLISSRLKQKKTYKFYMFDMEGKLVAANDLIDKRGVAFTNMQSGDYYFEILDEDDRVESGTITIK